jgi:tetratricopeptide (TPR) repeat protein
MHTSYDELDPSTARTYRLLSLHTGPDFTAGAAAALLDTDTSTAGRLITGLAEQDLLAHASPGRWHFPGLTGQHARDMATTHDTPDDRAAATARVIDYYLRGSAAADLLVAPGRLRIAAAFALPIIHPPAYNSPAAALAWHDTELANLLQAQQSALAFKLYSLGWQFIDTAWGWCRHRANYPAWEDLAQTAIESAHACGDARAEVLATIRLASCHLAQGNTTAATPLTARAIQTARTNGDRAGEGSACEHAAMGALAASDYPSAIKHCTRGLDCWRRVSSHRRPEALLHRLLGRAHAGLGDHHQAAAHLDTALGIFTDLGERYHSARTQYYIATTRLASSPSPGDIEEAITQLEQARPLLQAEDHPLALSELLTTLADAYSRIGKTSQATACTQEATTLQQQLNLPANHPARTRTSALASQLTASKQAPDTR